MPLVRNTRRGSFLAAGVEFKPGAVELDEDTLLRVLADASAASWFDCGILVLDDASPAVAVAALEPEPAPVAEVAPAMADPKERAPRRRRGG